MATTAIRSSKQLYIDANLQLNSWAINGLLDPSNAQDAATKHYVDSILATNNAMVYKGVLSTLTDYPAAIVGNTWIIGTAGILGGSGGPTVAVGDMLICSTANSGGTFASVGTDFDLIQVGVAGLVTTSSTTSTVGNITTFSGTGGNQIQDSGVALTSLAHIDQQFYLGTTSILINRSSGAIALTGITSIDGLAATATKLATARTINGVAFDGSANITIAASTTAALTIGTGLLGTSFNGSTAITITIDSTVTTLTGTQTLTNKTLTSPVLTTPVINGTPSGTGISTTQVANTLVLRDANANITTNNLIDGFISTASAGTTTTLTVASDYYQQITGTTTQTIVLPVTSTLVTGFAFYIVNSSTGLVTINSSGGNTVAILQANTSISLTCILNSGTTAASWYGQVNGTIYTNGKTLSVNNTLTLAGTDGATLNIGTGGTLGTGAYATIGNYALVGQTMYIGTTAVTINRSSATLALTGVSIDGNAGTATKLYTARTINGVAFDGTSNITITAANPSTLTIGTGLTGGSFNGSAAATIALDTTYMSNNYTPLVGNRRSYRVVPSGTINGTNQAFTLTTTSAIISGSEEVFVNGVLMNGGSGNDYTISYGTTTTITFTVAPNTTGETDVILVNYSI